VRGFLRAIRPVQRGGHRRSSAILPAVVAIAVLVVKSASDALFEQWRVESGTKRSRERATAQAQEVL
jgi:hypothetical protein